MSPSQYKARYENLSVSLDNGPPATVRVNQYRLRSMNYKAAANDAFISMLKKRGIDTELRVQTESGLVRVDPGLSQTEDAYKKRTGIELVFSEYGAGGQATKVDSRVTDWGALAHYTFLGKGSPEHCQIVLQLANHWGLAPDLQQYADDNLGLDCNGFVGNYLWHSKNGNPWMDLGVRNQDHGPDAWISGYFDGKRLLASWDDLDTSRSYIFGLVDNSGNIIPGGPGSSSGHIIITEPNRRNNRVGKDGKPFFAVWSVESTAGHTPGLWESWYTCTAVSNKIFSIDREQMIPGSRYLDFKIAAID
jgi:hypothetical protein